MAPGAAFFDLDKTVIAKSSALAFGRSFFANGLINRRAVLKATYAQLVYMSAGADEDQIERMRRHITALCAGWDAGQVRAIVTEALHEVVDPLVYGEATDLITQHKAAGRDIVIVSSSGSEIVGPIGELLGADRVIATEMVIEDGKYTGEIAYYAYGPQKARAVESFARDAGYDLADCFAYSDSYTDLPMLEVVGNPTAVNPDKQLRRIALERAWPILEFTHGVSLRERIEAISRPAPPVMAGAAVGVGAAVVGLAWLATRRRTADPAPDGSARST